MDSPGTPRLLRAINERALLDALRRGPTSRAQLARESGLSKPTVSQALANLERAGLVREVGRSSPARGRAAVLYEPDPTAGYVLGVDIGREYVRIAAADLAGAIIARRDERNRARTADALVTAVREQSRAVTKSAGLAWKRVVHVVVGGPGVVEDGRLAHAPNLPGWNRPGLPDALRQALGPRVDIDNDANLAAIGEHTYGRCSDVDTFAYLMLGTGVGMGVMLGGRLYRGAHGAAGEVAYLPLGATPDAAGAPPRGILEEAASAAAVVRSAERLGMPGKLTAKKIFDAARSGDKLALRVVDAEAERLALVVGAVAAILDPELVVLGGGVGGNVDLLRPRLETHLERLTPLRPPVAEGELGQDAIILGAIATALNVAREVVFEQRS